MARKRVSKKALYKKKRYWYHVSTTLRGKEVHLIPWDEKEGFNRGGDEPEGNRICVTPSIEQCLTAIPYTLNARCNIYRTKHQVMAIQPEKVFDAKVTQEGWLQKPTTFIKIGKLRFSDIECGLSQDIMDEAASSGHAPSSGKVLRWWKRANIKRFIKRA